jgi:hypothetical protein
MNLTPVDSLARNDAVAEIGYIVFNGAHPVVVRRVHYQHHYHHHHQAPTPWWSPEVTIMAAEELPSNTTDCI